MTGPGEPVLVDVTRGGRVESRHRGSLVLLDSDGAVALAVGLVDRPVFARSVLKPLQAAAMLAAGFAGPDEAVALASASHSGAAAHRDLARTVLAAAGLDEAALGCPPDLPLGRPELLEWVGGGGHAEPICHNCSGKHAAMLSTCVTNGWDVGAYLEPAHPLQRAIAARIEQLTGGPIAATSVDGCGAPAHAVTLGELARAFASIARAPADSPGGRVAGAMRAHPLLVGGVGRAVTDLIGEVDGLICKDGAEGVCAAALPDGRAVAAKVEDGAMRALAVLLAAAARHWGFDGAAVRQWAAPQVLGGSEVVGALTCSDELRTLLGG